MKCVILNNPFQLISIYKVDGGCSGGGKPNDILRSNRGQGEYYSRVSSRLPPKKPINLGNDLIIEEEDLVRFLNDLKEKDPAAYSAFVQYLKIHHPNIKVKDSWIDGFKQFFK